MAASFCLLPDKVEQFKRDLKEKNINIADLINMTTEERTKLLKNYAGESASDVNLLFEQKLVLKNRLQGIKNWASKVGEIGRYDPEMKANLAKLTEEFKARQAERIFSPKENEAFLNDLANQRIGNFITKEEANKVFELTDKAEEYKKAFDEKTGEWTSKESKAKYGASKVVLEKYTNQLKEGKLSIKNSFGKTVADIRQSGYKAPGVAVGKVIETIANNSTALVATLDDSFIGRQGLFTLVTHPTKWWPGAKNSILDWAKEIKDPGSAEDAIWADVYSSRDYMNGEYQKAGLIPKNEEQFPTDLPSTIPGVGRVFKGSQIAFTGSAIKMRIGVYDLLKEQAINNGIEWGDVNVKDNGRLVNSLTARGHIGEPGVIKLIFWAPRMVKGQYDVLTGHSLGLGLETKFAREQAAKNWVKIIATGVAINLIANAIVPGSASQDPTSADFGNIKLGNTRYNYTGGASSLITLASRLILGRSTSSTTGETKDYGTKIGQKSRFDAVMDFLVNKTNPPAHVIADYLRGQNFEGKPPSLLEEIYKAFTPIVLQNIIDLKDHHSADQMLGVITDFLGGNSNTYQDSNIKSGIIPENKQMSSKTFLDSALLYAGAFGSDPEDAFNKIFTGQKILKLSNGTIIVERMSVGDSQAYKKKYGANTKQVKLDHTVPLELGGTNLNNNLKLVSTSEWSSYTPVENALGKAIKNGRVSKDEAQRLIKKFKGISDTSDRKDYGQRIIDRFK